MIRKLLCSTDGWVIVWKSWLNVRERWQDTTPQPGEHQLWTSVSELLVSCAVRPNQSPPAGSKMETFQNRNNQTYGTQRDRGYKFNMNPSYCSSTLPFVLSVLGKLSHSWQTWRHFFICQPAFGPKPNQHYRSVSALPTDGRFPTMTLQRSSF